MRSKSRHVAALLFRRMRPKKIPKDFELKLVADAMEYSMSALAASKLRIRTESTASLDVIFGPEAHFDNEGRPLKCLPTYNWVRVSAFVGHQRVPARFRRAKTGLLTPIRI